MDLKFREIALIVIGVAAPTILLILGFTPGGLNFVGDIVMNSHNMPWLFFGGAGLLFCVLAYRIFRRIRPAPKNKQEEETAPHITPTPKFSLRQRADSVDGEKPGGGP
ncbi:MAG: hypothetical protein ABL956_04900 [Hyphomonadaceae bacterium]